MKKNLLIALAVMLTISVTAQNRVKIPNYRNGNKVSAPNKMFTEPSPSQAVAHPISTPVLRRHTPTVNSPAAVIACGNNPNAFSCANNSRSNMASYDSTNTIVFIHRGVGFPTVGYYVYDMSNDGGNTWSSDLGPIYVDPGTQGARYPVCGIYNPAGNTTGTESYISYYGPYTDNQAAGTWPGTVSGGSKLDATGVIQHATTGSPMTFAENMTVVKNTQEAWRIGSLCTPDATPTYLDSSNVSHGIWNSGTNEYNFTEQHWPVPVFADNHLIVDQDIAFSDDGQTGYVAMIINNDPTLATWHDSTLYIQIYKTRDGGAHWDNPCDIDFRTAVDSLLAQDSTAEYSSTFDLDLVVDMNGHLHILTGIAPGAGFSIFTGAGIWGMFDIYNDNTGNWYAQLLDMPMTFRGVFGDGGTNPTLNEDSRPFACRSWDGSKLFFNWFDTDTNTFGSAVGNLAPDLHSIGYDVATGLWTHATNLTAGTLAEGACTFGNGGYYAIGQGGNVYSIPTMIQILSSASATASPTTFAYISGADVDMSTAINAGNPVTLACINPTSVNQIKSPKSFSVSANYPNPFNGKTSIDVSLTKACDVTIEVSSLLGQVMSTSKYSNLNSGVHTLTIDANKLAAGVYTYKVRAGNEIVTQKMIVR